MSDKQRPFPPIEPLSEINGDLKLSKIKKNSVGTPALIGVVEQVKDNMFPGEAIKTMFKLNQKGGFDCPGCAWPDPDDDRSQLGEYCENGIKAIAEEATKRRVTADFFAQHSVEELSTWSDFKIGKSGRLTAPMVLREGGTHYESISWNEAFKLIGKELNQLNSPNEAAFYTSGRTSNEAAFLYQIFVREFGTNNLPDCSNMCHEPTGAGLSETVGIGKGSVTLNDLYDAEVIMILGQNPGTNHPRMLNALEKCKDNGGKIISVNPLPETALMKYTNPQSPVRMLTKGVKISDLFLQVKVNGDAALLKALLVMMLEAEKANPGKVFDRDFINNKTQGYQELIADLEQQDLDDLIAQSGIPRKQVEQTAELLINNKRIVICWAMGITQHENGIDNVREIVNILLLKGSIGINGGGTCPVRGHSNVQGDRTVGVWEKLKPQIAENIKKVFGFDPPREEGYDTVGTVKALYEGKLKVFFGMGGNFVPATPDTDACAAGMRKTNLTVHVSTKLNRSHLIHGKQALILPCLGRTEVDFQKDGEQFVSVENSVGVVHSSEGVLPPVSDELKSECAIVCEMAKATLGKKSKIDWDKMMSNYDNIRDAIEQVIPAGFDNYNERVRIPMGFYLNNGARKQEFHTDTGKAKFTINKTSSIQLNSDEYLLTTLRSHDQFNTTIYGLNDRYRGIKGERRVIMMNKKDIKAAGLKSQQIVNIVSNYDDIERWAKQFLVVPYDIPERCVAVYFPEGNALIPIDRVAGRSNTPNSKSVVVKLIH